MLRPSCRALLGAAPARRRGAPQTPPHAPPLPRPRRRAACSAAPSAPPAAGLQPDTPPVAAPPPAGPRPVKLQLTTQPARPNKSLGQHFLSDASVLKAALAAAGVAPGDRVLEIGAGTGVLTRALLAAGARVTAVERDRALATALAENNGELLASGALRVVHDDALRWLRGADAAASFPDRSVSAAGDGGSGAAAPRAKVVANIPYAISSELLGLLLPRGAAFGAVVLLVQDEWAQRLVSAPVGAADAREMSMRVRYYSTPRYVRFVPRASFSPPPNVDSAVVAFALRQPSDWPLPPGPRTAALFAMLRTAFASRRKMLRKTLAASAQGASGEAVAAALDAAGASPDARPQELSLQQFLALFDALQPVGDAAASA